MENLEGQVVEIEEDIADLDQDVNFLFDETVIQDERLFQLEQTTDSINAELVAVDDELETINDDLDSEFSKFSVTFHISCFKTFLDTFKQFPSCSNMLFAFY